MIRFDHHLWSRFHRIAAPYWFGEEKWPARRRLLMLIVLLLGQTGFAVLFNEQTGEFTSALAAKDTDRFWLSIEKSLGILLIGVPVFGFYYYVRDQLALHWRRWLTRDFLGDYFSDRAYYELNASADIDNPDQRIAEDINTFTQRSLQFLMVIFGALLQLLAFAGVLWSISRELVAFLLVYAAAGTLVTLMVFGKTLISLNFYQLKREANFRYSLVRIRENAEAIAFYRGEARESSQVGGYFNEIFANLSKLIRVQLKLNLFQFSYSFLTVVLPSAIIADRVISGELEVGRAIQAAGAFAAILSALTVIIDNFDSLSKFAAGIKRLDTFRKFLVADGRVTAAEDRQITCVSGPDLAVDNLTLRTPNHERTLLRSLSLSVSPGQGLLIVGPSGCGKSSLLRAIAGLWHAGSGRIIGPDSQEMLFLPQRPYMVQGTLREQLLYPNRHLGRSDDELLEVMKQVNLPDLATNFDGLAAVQDWGKVLSVGEQQRVAFARILLIGPRYAILDEATSALDIANEENLYRLLAATSTTFVSVGHRPSILKFHPQVLKLSGDGDWKLYAAKDFRFE
ncbi:ABC transporter ATP-binding protein/permease [Dechloromonas sp.]|uniref:ABC transporter ATP-binding protein/permease n=1 Tax=Dechloromonas sp. TaxID=1917218 RepID=UPI00121EADDF|nr:ABC transporter ATP-binding protein/permease [Dechloromonas sp.]MBU3698168.1 ABC transporter ATP-binding protein/permease [Dechloromonas sp.]TEX50106.1 MAG: ABC transporter ATP-binding protein [Rhodocyclaceae bacterium]